MTKKEIRNEIQNEITYLLECCKIDGTIQTAIDDYNENGKTAKLDDLKMMLETLQDLAQNAPVLENGETNKPVETTKKHQFKFVAYGDIKPEKISFDDVKINDIIGVRFDTVARNNFIKSGVMYDENNPEFYPEFENGVDFCKVIKKTTKKAKDQYIDVQSIKTGVVLRYFPENFEKFIGDDNLSFRVYQTA